MPRIIIKDRFENIDNGPVLQCIWYRSSPNNPQYGVETALWTAPAGVPMEAQERYRDNWRRAQKALPDWGGGDG